MNVAKIIIDDEVNAKIQGLELSCRKKLHNKFQFEVPNARFLPAVKLGRWNGKTSFFGMGGVTYINLLDQIIPILEEYGYDIELEDTRNYSTTFTFDEVKEDSFSDKTWPKGHDKENQPIMLRDYQVDTINMFLNNIQCMQEAATGSGKTIMTAVLSKSVEKYGRSIIIVPSKNLVIQTEADYINLGLDVGVFFGDRKEYSKMHTICTWQSLNNLLKDTQSNETDITIDDFIKGVVCVMVDECHSAKADVLKKLLTGELAKIPIRWGLTGTVPKDDMSKTSLLVSIGSVVNKLSASDLQEKGVLANCHVNILQFKDQPSFTNYQSELKYLLENEKRLDKIAMLINSIKDSGNTLVLLDRVNAGTEVVSRIPNAVFVSGKTKLIERIEEYDEVAVEDNKVLVCTYGVAAVGINVPRLFNVVLIEPGKSFVRVIQSIGRGLRKASDKDFVQIWDITSTCKFSKRHLAQRKVFYKEANYQFTVEKIDL